MAKAPLGTIRGAFYRAVPAAAAGFALEDGPSYTFRNRYNVPNQFGALYFADQAAVCKATLEKRGLLGSRRLPFVMLSFDIRVDHILDLTQRDTWSLLGVTRADLIMLRPTPNAYRTTHAIALGAYESNRIWGLLAPDATECGNSLTLFPARLLAKDFVRLKDTVAL